MQWDEVPETVDAWTRAVAAQAWDIKQACADIYTATDVGYYVNALSGQVSVFGPEASRFDLARCKTAAERSTGSAVSCLTTRDLADPAAPLVKVAYSPVLRRLGELLNFFPGQYPGGIPNAPSPLAAMLTSGLVGAGLGWGAGRLAKKVLPRGYGERLGRTGALVGGLIGASPGAVWSAANLMSGKSLLDPWPLNTAPDAPPEYNPNWKDEQPATVPPAVDVLKDIHFRDRPTRAKIGADEWPELSPQYLAAAHAFTKQAYGESFGDMAVADVNVNHLGQTLWETGASPALASTIMGTMYAARQLPDDRARPDYVTGQQLGQLAANTVGDYAKGYLTGVAVNAIIGTPYRAPAFGVGGVALGLLGAVVPRLFSG